MQSAKLTGCRSRFKILTRDSEMPQKNAIPLPELESLAFEGYIHFSHS
nr:MAG TPA: hypothetical protein [Caudoviricetes sp.]